MRIEIFPAESIAPYCKIEIAGAIGFTDSTPQLPTVVTLNVVKLRLRSRPETFKSAQQTKRRTNRGKRARNNPSRNDLNSIGFSRAAVTMRSNSSNGNASGSLILTKARQFSFSCSTSRVTPAETLLYSYIRSHGKVKHARRMSHRAATVLPYALVKIEHQLGRDRKS